MAKTYTHLHFHIVFATKHRLPLIQPAIRGELYRFVGGATAAGGGRLDMIGGVADHVHLLVGLKPTLALSAFVQQIKGASSRWLNQRGTTGDRFAWQEGYGAFTVSASQMPVVKRYIERQEEHHRELSFSSEMRLLLQRHGVEFSEKELEG